MNPQVERIRKLLAKAASTEFPAEKRALRAKAAELQSRHGITEAMLAPDRLKPKAGDRLLWGFTVNTARFDASMADMADTCNRAGDAFDAFRVAFDGDVVEVKITGI